MRLKYFTFLQESLLIIHLWILARLQENIFIHAIWSLKQNLIWPKNSVHTNNLKMNFIFHIASPLPSLKKINKGKTIG